MEVEAGGQGAAWTEAWLRYLFGYQANMLPARKGGKGYVG
jgi:hypothetical protein